MAFKKKLFLLIRGVLKTKIDFHELIERYNQSLGKTHLSKSNKRFLQQVALFSKNKMIIDVGALDGWFAKSVFRFNDSSKIISFEPLKSQLPYLEELKKSYPDRFNYENFALGLVNGKSTIYEIGTTGLSSFKKLNKELYDSWGFNTSIKESYEVNVIKLDDYIEKNNFQSPIFLKIDTQGYEMEVLMGAEKYLKTGLIEFVSIELMTEMKYDDSKLYDEIMNYLWLLDFHIVDINCSGYNVKNSYLSEFDVIFKKQ